MEDILSYFAIDIANSLGHLQFLEKAFVFGGVLSVFDLATAVALCGECKGDKYFTQNPTNSSKYLNIGQNLNPDHVMEVRLCK